MKLIASSLLLAAMLPLSGADVDLALQLYRKTDYQGALKALEPQQNLSAAGWAVAGKSYFQLGDFKRSRESFEKALAAAPTQSEYALWLGRSLGRLAETSSFLSAPGYATKARDAFEQAVRLDPNNKEAMSDLFEYYIEAPGFLGGGLDKAGALAERVARLDAAEGMFMKAQLADKRKEFDKAEEHLRRATELAPRQVGRVVDLAKYLARRGRPSESDQVFEQALKLAPNAPKVLFEWARVLIRDKRNLPQAKAMLQRYVAAPLTPDDPPREEARKLLRQLGA